MSTRSSLHSTAIERGDEEEDVILLLDSPTMRGVQTLVAMPAYNEEAAIAKTVLGARKHADAVLVVDDGSEDETAAIAEALGAVVVRHRENKGYGGALQTIFATAREMDVEELVIIDVQHDSSEIPEVLSELREGSDVVVSGAESLAPAAYGRQAIEVIRVGGNGASIGSEILSQVQDLEVTGVPPRASKEPLYRGKRIAVVVPAYNEEDLIAETLDGIPDYVTRVYAVDDGSSDMTGAIINEWGQRDPRIVAIHHNPNQGLGAAIISGYSQAQSDGMDIVATMDGDGQMDPRYLSKFLDPIVEGRCDFTLGNRLGSPEYRGRMSKWRFLGNTILTFLTKIASGYWTMVDPQNGYTAISRRALENIDFKDMYRWYGCANDRLVRLNVHGFQIQNVAHPAIYGNEKSTIKYGHYIVRVSNLLLRNFLWRLKMKYVMSSFHPLVLFYLFGSMLTVIGLVAGGITLWEKLVWGHPVLFVHGVLSLLAFMMGVMFLSFAMLFDMVAERQNYGWY